MNLSIAAVFKCWFVCKMARDINHKLTCGLKIARENNTGFLGVLEIYSIFTKYYHKNIVNAIP